MFTQQEKQPEHQKIPDKNPDANRKKEVPGYDEKNPGQSYPDKK